MKGVYVSLSARVLVNLESLNMAESVGNVTKHRKAPVVLVGEDDGYRLVYVPVVSGMSLAHHYQRLLARIAADRGISVTKMSLMGYFMKFADREITRNFYGELGVHELIGKKSIRPEDMCEIEKRIVGGCVVADVGGFLQTESGVKRTSRFSFSYMMPALDALRAGAAALIPQLHVRYTPTAERGQQALIYIENGGAVYTFSYVLEASEVSRLTVCESLGVREPPALLSAEERRRRVEAALDTLAVMLDSMLFGAKRTRSLPHWQPLSIVVAASSGPAPFIASGGHGRGYLVDTVARAEKLRATLGGEFEYRVFYYEQGEELDKPGSGEYVEAASSVADAVGRAKRWVLERL